MNDSEREARRSGFLSEEDKRKFTTVAGVLGGAFFIVQLAAPMVAMFAMMPAMMLGDGFKTYRVEGAALYRDEPIVVETRQALGATNDDASRSRLVRVGPEGIEEAAPLGGWRPELLPDDERLWLVSSSRVAVLENGQIRELPSGEPLGDICRPFLLRGRPTVVENRPDGGRLAAWTGEGWETIRELESATGRCRFQPVAVDDSVWLFRRDGDTLYVRDAASVDDDDGWRVVLSQPSEWYAFVLAGRPAVASIGLENGFRIVRHDGARWSPVASAPGTLGMSMGLAAFEKSDGTIAILTQSFPGSLAVRIWTGERLSEALRFGSSFPFPPAMMALMSLPYLGTMTMSLLLAVILSGLMRSHRVTHYRHEGTEVAFASLTRRALSQIVDAGIVGLPFAAVYWRTFGDFGAMLERGPAVMLHFFAWFGISIVWMGLAFVGFSIGEGFWGATPGKWLVGIRVVGTDLRPCGLGRALVRNFLKLVDGFFNYLVGILLIAFTPEWQRLGDLAARTVVIENEKG